MGLTFKLNVSHETKFAVHWHNEVYILLDIILLIVQGAPSASRLGWVESDFECSMLPGLRGLPSMTSAL